MQIITISNLDRQEFFFTKNYTQDHGLGPDWVHCSTRIPMYVEPRPCVPDGWVRNVEDYINVFYDDHIQIENPDRELDPYPPFTVSDGHAEAMREEWEEYDKDNGNI
jgi:hypothetical protein